MISESVFVPTRQLLLGVMWFGAKPPSVVLLWSINDQRRVYNSRKFGRIVTYQRLFWMLAGRAVRIGPGASNNAPTPAHGR
jgi:hypothetical protein